MQRPPLPAKTTTKHSCRPEWGQTACAPLSVEQSHLRPSPSSFLQQQVASGHRAVRSDCPSAHSGDSSPFFPRWSFRKNGGDEDTRTRGRSRGSEV